jgi:hypothetical protein
MCDKDPQYEHNCITELDFFEIFPPEPDLDSYIDAAVFEEHLKEYCKVRKCRFLEWRACKKHKAQTFKRRG